MQQILNFLIKFKVGLLFLFLLFVGLRLTFYAHTYQNSSIVNSTNFVSSNIYYLQSSISDYFNLKPQNEVLQQENSYLREQLLNLGFTYQIDSLVNNKILNQFLTDSLFEVIPAQVVSNNFRNPDNYLLIDVGTSSKVTNDLAVVSSLGIVGITEHTTNNYSRVISVLNRNIAINAKLKQTNHFGTLTWDAKSPQSVKLKDVPRSAPVKIGDTITTGGKSFIFPGKLPIGVIENYSLDQNQGYFEIDVRLFNDMTNLGRIYVLKNLRKNEALTTLKPENSED